MSHIMPKKARQVPFTVISSSAVSKNTIFSTMLTAADASTHWVPIFKLSQGFRIWWMIDILTTSPSVLPKFIELCVETPCLCPSETKHYCSRDPTH